MPRDDGVMLSNGPGDPAENGFCIEQIRLLMDKLPVFGICLGHQMMALAAGARTRKMKFGHRGANQPAKDLATGRVYVTSQNHGYAVDNASLDGSGAVMRFVNVNDGSCEGLDYSRQARLLPAVPPRGARGTARLRRHVRQIRSHDGGKADA